MNKHCPKNGLKQVEHIHLEAGGGGGTVGSDVTLRENWSVFIRCRTMPLGAALAL